ncbi:MAG: geranylgeranylglyceryl/heptaprenylglyceryl phosphate synthase [Sediminibacterium sp.]|nr:geranylgeranylglyceryl/heptaprenylglyceryl phosphate synthase [Sediminibacterium sp.]
MSLNNLSSTSFDNLYHSFLDLKVNQKTVLAVLIDPDKTSPNFLTKIIENIKFAPVQYIFIGGSLINNFAISEMVTFIKSKTSIPVILFPGHPMQFEENFDGLLFLSLISGRNAELLIGQHVLVATKIRQSKVEVLPTGYMLIDGGKATSVSYISNTIPIPADKNDIAISTALAGEMLGLKLIFMDAGSGAYNPIDPDMVNKVAKVLKIPLIVGGGIKTAERINDLKKAGANVIVLGNCLESNPDLLKELNW